MALKDDIKKKRPFEHPEEEAFLNLVRTTTLLVADFERLFKEHALSEPQYNVLRILRGVYPSGHPRGEIARRMIHRSPDVTRMLDRLVRQGLVARSRNPEDRRESIATITRAGLALLERLDPELHQAFRALTSALSETELRRLARLCDALVP